MTNRKGALEPLHQDLPVYPIGVAAQLLDVHPRTLRIYEREGLIKPHRRGRRRLYSANDLKWISCLRSLIHDQGISIPGIKKLLRFATCYEILDCPEEVHCHCDAVVDRVIPRGLRLAGNPATEREAAERERQERRQQRQQRGEVKNGNRKKPSGK